jgi:hypothetical protein
MILLEQLLFEIFGRQYNVVLKDNSSGQEEIFPALLSKNTKVGERPYRFTWFNKELIPYKHYDIDDSELKALIDNNQLPDRVKSKISGYMTSQEGHNVTILRVEPNNSPI